MMKCEEPSKLQNECELRDLIELFRIEQVKSYLEIGSKLGCSLWQIANSLPKGSRVVSVEWPHGKIRYQEDLPHLEKCIEALGSRGYDAHLIVGDSTDPFIVEQVHKLGPFDACFIDANHTEPFVRKDWANYSVIARLVAFHDINDSRWRPPERIPIEVKKVWDGMKTKYRYREFKRDHDVNGIGVVWQ